MTAQLDPYSEGIKKIQNNNDCIRKFGKTEKGTIIPEEFKGNTETVKMGEYLQKEGYQKIVNGAITTYKKLDIFVKVIERDGEFYLSLGKDAPIGYQVYETSHRYKDSLFNELEYLETTLN